MLSLAEELEQLIFEAVPDAVKVSKYGGTLFTLRPELKEGQFCGLFIYKSHVQISFSKGALLEDPCKLLIGDGKVRRHINFSVDAEIDCDALLSLLQCAARFSRTV